MNRHTVTRRVRHSFIHVHAVCPSLDGYDTIRWMSCMSCDDFFWFFCFFCFLTGGVCPSFPGCHLTGVVHVTGVVYVTARLVC